MENINNALEQAGKCLNCKKPMCSQKGCPVGTNIPKFIEELKNQNFEKAYEILQENNILSEICSSICPVETQCVGSCIRGINSEPVKINYLENFTNNWANQNNIKYIPKIKNTTSKKVAIIGSGPAGIACGVELKKAGAEVTIFEKENKCGGILEYGIPDFRINKKSVSNTIERLKSMGIIFKTGFELGRNLTIQNLKDEGFENIFLGIGGQTQKTYKLTDKQTKDIYKSDEFLKTYNEGRKINGLGITVVIGGGNVAFDAARAATRMGAEKVYVLYRRNKDLMPAREIELKDAIKEGVEVVFQTKVISASIENERLQKIECIKTRIEDEKAIDIENTNFRIKANSIIFAIGYKPNDKLLENLGITTQNGLCKVDQNYMTNIEGIYAGGDLIEHKSTVAKAISTGKKAAYAILNREESDT